MTIAKQKFAKRLTPQSLNRNLKNIITRESTSVTVLAAITGRSLINKPYNNQQDVPVQKIRNIPSERLLAERLWYVFTTCGTNAMVVRAPATRPRILTGSMLEIKGEIIHALLAKILLRLLLRQYKY